MYIHISQTVALVLCPFLTVTFCSWPTGHVSVSQGVCGVSPDTISCSYLFTCWHSRWFMYFSSQLTTLQTVIMSFNLGLSLRKDPRSVERPLVVTFDVCEYVQLTVQLKGSGQECGGWNWSQDWLSATQEVLLLHWCISEAFQLTKPHLEIDPLRSRLPDTCQLFLLHPSTNIYLFFPLPLKCTKILEHLNLSPPYRFRSFTSFIRLPLPFIVQLKESLVLW